MSTKLGLAAIALMALAGCAEETPLPAEPPPPLPDDVQVQRVDLNAALGVERATVVGVTIDPDTGARYVLDADLGLWELHGDGTASPLADLQQLYPADMAFSLATDIAALGDMRFAVTVQGVGFVYAHHTGNARQHFCYEPGWVDPGQWDEGGQVSDALAYDASTDRLIANPTTTTADGQRLDVATFDATTGQDLDWFPIPGNRAGALTIDGSDVLLAKDDGLWAYTLGEPMDRGLVSLASVDATTISGLALDPVSDQLLVVDGLDQELIVLDGWRP